MDPGRSQEALLPLKIEGLPTILTPVNSRMSLINLDLQVAVKNSSGIVYFQTLVPLYILFQEGGSIPQQQWLQMWKQGISNQEYRSMIRVSNQPIPNIKSKLESKGFYVVAERQFDNKV